MGSIKQALTFYLAYSPSIGKCSATIKMGGINGGNVTTLAETGQDLYLTGYAIDSTTVYWTQFTRCYGPCGTDTCFWTCCGTVNKVLK